MKIQWWFILWIFLVCEYQPFLLINPLKSMFLNKKDWQIQVGEADQKEPWIDDTMIQKKKIEKEKYKRRKMCIWKENKRKEKKDHCVKDRKVVVNNKKEVGMSLWNALHIL